MRTYYFAAENKDAMIQWMNAMSLASIGEQEKDLSKGRLDDREYLELAETLQNQVAAPENCEWQKDVKNTLQKLQTSHVKTTNK